MEEVESFVLTLELLLLSGFTVFVPVSGDSNPLVLLPSVSEELGSFPVKFESPDPLPDSFEMLLDDSESLDPLSDWLLSFGLLFELSELLSPEFG